jgi:hypothetical protein
MFGLISPETSPAAVRLTEVVMTRIKAGIIGVFIGNILLTTSITPRYQINGIGEEFLWTVSHSNINATRVATPCFRKSTLWTFGPGALLTMLIHRAVYSTSLWFWRQGPIPMIHGSLFIDGQTQSIWV